jgi:hypothetical protein
MKKEEIVRTLLSAGAKSVKNLAVKNVTVAPQENYVRLGLTLEEEVDGMVTNDNGVTYEKGKTKVIFVSLFSVISLLKDDDNAAFATNHLLEHPSAMNVVLNRAKIDIIQEDVVSGEEYKNPWSENAEAIVFDHDTVINHLVNIKLSDFAIAKLDKLADNLLGF